MIFICQGRLNYFEVKEIPCRQLKDCTGISCIRLFYIMFLYIMLLYIMLFYIMLFYISLLYIRYKEDSSNSLNIGLKKWNICSQIYIHNL